MTWSVFVSILSILERKLYSQDSVLNFSYKEHQRLSSSSVWLISLSVQSFKIHPPRNQWHNYLILVALFFHSARLSDGPLSIWNTFS